VKKILLGNLKRRPRPTQGCRADDDYDDGDVHGSGLKRNQQHEIKIKKEILLATDAEAVIWQNDTVFSALDELSKGKTKL